MEVNKTMESFLIVEFSTVNYLYAKGNILCYSTNLHKNLKPTVNLSFKKERDIE